MLQKALFYTTLSNSSKLDDWVFCKGEKTLSVIHLKASLQI